MYYKHSGRCTPAGLLLALAAGAASAPILAWAYGSGLILITDEHFAMFATIAFGALMGLAVGYGSIWGKVRNLPVTIVAAGVMSTIAWYLSWAVWESVVLANDGIIWTSLVKRPGEVWRMACIINQYGTWGTTANGPATKGTELWLLWIAEAIGVIGGAILIADEIVKHYTFCERCDGWASGRSKIVLAPPPNVEILKRQLEAKDLRALESRGPGSKNAASITLNLQNCESCRQFHTLTLTSKGVTRNWLRQTRTTTRKVMRNLLITPEQAETLRHIAEKVAQTGNIAPPAASRAAAGKR